MTIFGQKIFWNFSTVMLLILALIKLLWVLWCPKHRRLSHRKFLSAGNTWKQWRFKFSKLSRKVVWLPWQHTWVLIGRTEFSEWKIPRKKNHKAETPNSRPFWRYAVILVRGHNCLDRVDQILSGVFKSGRAGGQAADVAMELGRAGRWHDQNRTMHICKSEEC